MRDGHDSTDSKEGPVCGPAVLGMWPLSEVYGDFEDLLISAEHGSSAICDMDVATDRWASATEIRKADRSRASGPPSSSDGRSPNSSTRRRSPRRRLTGTAR